MILWRERGRYSPPGHDTCEREVQTVFLIMILVREVHAGSLVMILGGRNVQTALLVILPVRERYS